MIKKGEKIKGKRNAPRVFPGFRAYNFSCELIEPIKLIKLIEPIEIIKLIKPIEPFKLLAPLSIEAVDLLFIDHWSTGFLIFNFPLLIFTFTNYQSVIVPISSGRKVRTAQSVAPVNSRVPTSRKQKVPQKITVRLGG